jgi:hypothetical protein
MAGLKTKQTTEWVPKFLAKTRSLKSKLGVARICFGENIMFLQVGEKLICLSQA